MEPVQLNNDYLKEYRETTIDSGIVKLCRAILTQAIQDIEHGFNTNKASEWIMDESNDCFSFIAICELLKLDHFEIRKQIKNYLKKCERE